jgi:hypothetical protein
MRDLDLETFLKDVPQSTFARRLLKSYIAIEGDAVRAHARILRDIEFFEGSAVPERAVILKAALRLLIDQYLRK